VRVGVFVGDTRSVSDLMCSYWSGVLVRVFVFVGETVGVLVGTRSACWFGSPCWYWCWSECWYGCWSATPSACWWGLLVGVLAWSESGWGVASRYLCWSGCWCGRGHRIGVGRTDRLSSTGRALKVAVLWAYWSVKCSERQSWEVAYSVRSRWEVESGSESQVYGAGRSERERVRDARIGHGLLVGRDRWVMPAQLAIPLSRIVCRNAPRRCCPPGRTSPARRTRPEGSCTRTQPPVAFCDIASAMVTVAPRPPPSNCCRARTKRGFPRPGDVILDRHRVSRISSRGVAGPSPSRRCSRPYKPSFGRLVLVNWIDTGAMIVTVALPVEPELGRHC